MPATKILYENRCVVHVIDYTTNSYIMCFHVSFDC